MRWECVTLGVYVVRTDLARGEPMPETIARLASILPNATLETLPGQIHFAPSMVPETVARKLAEFLS